MAREVATRLRRARARDAAHYAQLDMRLTSKLGAALGFVAVGYTLALLPLAPSAHGLVGWLTIAGCMAATALASLALLRAGERVRPAALLAGSFAAPVVVGVVEYVTGPGTPYQQLLLLPCLYVAAVHPPRRAALAVLAIAVSAWAPLLYHGGEQDFVARTTGQIAIWCALAVVVAVYTARMRTLRRELSEAREAADRRALLDPLTGLGNRRALDDALPAAAASAHRHARPLSALVADLDDFKRINDTFGHHAGDEMLRDVARALVGSLRIPDPCFRWGGDEFVALLPEADLGEARVVAGRVQAAVSGQARSPDGRPVRISVGIAQIADGETGEQLLGRADAALLAGKGAGGRRLVPAT